MKNVLSLCLLLCLAVVTLCQQPAPVPAKTLTWKPKADYADSFISDGATIRLIHDQGLTIAVFGYHQDDYLVTEVTVANGSNERMDVIPASFIMELYDDKHQRITYAQPIAPAKVAGKYRGRAKWGNFFRAFAAGMAQSTATTTGAVSLYGNGQTANGTYTATTTSPNTGAQRAAIAASQQATAEAEARAVDVLDTALFANTLFPQTYISGLVYFPHKKADMSVVYVIVNGVGYSFPFGKS